MKHPVRMLLFMMIMGSSACKTIQVSDFHISSSAPHANLPKLQIHYDQTSFESAFSRGLLQTTGSSSGIILGDQPLFFDNRSFSSRSIQQSDKRYQDVMTLFEREMYSQLIEMHGEAQGSMVLKLPIVESRFHRLGLLVPHLLTSGLISLTGMPFYHYETAMEVELEVYNHQNQLIRKYRGYGEHSIPIALYGYMATHSGDGQQSGVRKTNMQAFRQAIHSIKEQMLRDQDYLRKALQ
ncbi:MAG: hypothetical protein ACK417_05215 [Bacteroidia bacterium]